MNSKEVCLLKRLIPGTGTTTIGFNNMEQKSEAEFNLQTKPKSINFNEQEMEIIDDLASCPPMPELKRTKSGPIPDIFMAEELITCIPKNCLPHILACFPMEDMPHVLSSYHVGQQYNRYQQTENPLQEFARKRIRTEAPEDVDLPIGTYTVCFSNVVIFENVE